MSDTYSFSLIKNFICGPPRCRVRHSESEILKANCSIIYPLRYHYIVIRNKGMILFDNLIYVLHLHSIYVENIQELYKLNSKKCLMINLD